MGLSESKFNMWRAIIALTLADGVVTNEEREFLDNSIERLNFSNEQKTTLHEDIKSPQDVNEFWEKITDEKDRGQFIYFARLLFWSDGDFACQEKEIFDHFRQGVLSKVDVDKAMNQADEKIKIFESQYSESLGVRGKIGSIIGDFLGF